MTSVPDARDVGESSYAIPGRRWVLLLVVVLVCILLPFALFGRDMDRWATLTLQGRHQTASLMVVVALLAADVVLPLPSSIVATYAGIAGGPMLGSLANWMGMTLGAVSGYWIGRFGGRRVLVARGGGFSPQGAGRRLNGHLVSVIAARAVPVLAEATTVLAGAAKIPFGRFFLATSLANAGIGSVYAATGAFAANVNSFLLAFVSSLLLPTLALGIHRLWRRQAGNPDGIPPRA